MNIKVSVKGVKEVETRLKNLKRYAMQVENAPAPTLIRPQVLDDSLDVAREVYKTPSNLPNYPLRWKSKKQRIAVIIRLKEEGNLPYRRTGRLEHTWSASLKSKIISIANNARDRKTGAFIAPFVIGAFQQPFHKDTGWTKRSASIEKKIVTPILIEVKRQAFLGVEKSRFNA
jgi:hypothetical protein